MFSYFLDSVGRDESRIPFMHSFTKELKSFVVPIGKNIIQLGIFSASFSSRYVQKRIISDMKGKELPTEELLQIIYLFNNGTDRVEQILEFKFKTYLEALAAL